MGSAMMERSSSLLIQASPSSYQYFGVDKNPKTRDHCLC